MVVIGSYKAIFSQIQLLAGDSAENATDGGQVRYLEQLVPPTVHEKVRRSTASKIVSLSGTASVPVLVLSGLGLGV